MKHVNKMEKKGFKYAFCFSILFLSGCAGMNGKFDCNVNSGGKCAPMNQINKMADTGLFNKDNFYKSKNLMQANNKATGYPMNIFEGAPIRSGESIQQIWIGPYEDITGNYHEPSYVYTVVKKGKWIGEPANVIQD
ncbi:MAG: type IV conjugative transfer system lipoprotein TraV [Gammaproteobacteria bacterium]|nr:type IV conjugative transfer system lipoprotein TraV [Gammaproteobacteria bacterium]